MRVQEPSPEEVTGPITGAASAPRRFGNTTKLLALVAVAVVAGVVWWLANSAGEPDRSQADQAGGQPSAAAKQRFQRVGGPVDNPGCVHHAYGKVKKFFAKHDCGKLHQVLYASHTAKGRVLSSVSTVTMTNAKQAGALKRMTDSDATGNVTDLVTAGVRLPGGPKTVKGGGYASQRDGTRFIVVESAFFDGAQGEHGGGEHSEDALLTSVSRAALARG